MQKGTEAPGRGMYAEERRQEIALLIRGEGRGDVAELAGRFGVTPETIRRDLSELERRNVVRRVHGGAIPIERFRAEPALDEKATAMATEKTRIARAALSFVPERGSVLLDAGTTTLALAQLVPDREISVFTNAMPIGLELAGRPTLQLHLIGGRVRGRTLAHVDDWAFQALSDLRVDVAFVGTNGLTVERGLSTPDPSEAAVKRAMVRAAQQVVVLADHSKVGIDSTVRFAPIEEVDVLVTDRGLHAEVRDELEEAGVEVVVA